jgi:uncharacterized protein (DUF1778 family)
MASAKPGAIQSSHATISLSKRGQEALAGLLENPPAPTAAMKKLMSMPDLSPRKVARKA